MLMWRKRWKTVAYICIYAEQWKNGCVWWETLGYMWRNTDKADLKCASIVYDNIKVLLLKTYRNEHKMI